MTLLSKGAGCYSCNSIQSPYTYGGEGDENFYSYITSPGYDGIPPAEAF